MSTQDDGPTEGYRIARSLGKQDGTDMAMAEAALVVTDQMPSSSAPYLEPLTRLESAIVLPRIQLDQILAAQRQGAVIILQLDDVRELTIKDQAEELADTISKMASLSKALGKSKKPGGDS